MQEDDAGRGGLIFLSWGHGWDFRRLPGDPTTLEGPVNAPGIVQVLKDAIGSHSQQESPLIIDVHKLSSQSATSAQGSSAPSPPRPMTRAPSSPTAGAPRPPEGPNVAISYDKPSAGNRGPCDPAYEIGLINYEGLPVTATYHVRVVDNGIATEANSTIQLPARGSIYLGCTSGTTIGHTFQTNATIISKAFAK